MENYQQTEQQDRAKIQLNDTMNDNYWHQKYGVSSEELKANHEIGILAKILDVNIKNNVLAI